MELAAAEAAEEDPDFAPDHVRAAGRNLFIAIEKAWDSGDRFAMRGLVAPDLLVEWERRLDDFDARGWHNHVEPIGEPTVEYVGLTRTGDAATDRVVIKVDARVKDYVVDRHGRRIKRTGRVGEITRVREFWTLQKREGHWTLASIEQGGEGKHALDEQIVATAWGDEAGMRDEALIQGAVADRVPEGTTVAEVADLQYEGDAHAAAMDLSLADGRFAPDVLEIAARRAVSAWAQAIDGDDALLDGIATPAAKRELLYAGDTSGSVRIVVRGPVVNRIRIVNLDAGRRAADDDGRSRPDRPPLRGEPRHGSRPRRQPDAQDELHRALDAEPDRRRRAAVADHRRRRTRRPRLTVEHQPAPRAPTAA